MGNPLSTQGGFDKPAVVAWYMYGMKSFGQEAFDSFAFPPPCHDIEDMKDDICIITGANSGLGYKTAEALAKAGAKVHMICRDPARGGTAYKQLAEIGNVTLHLGDMSNPNSVKKVASEILNATNGRINVLVNNAGVLCEQQKTIDNPQTTKRLDASWATMVGGSYLLTGLFKDALLNEASKGHRSRVIDISSGGHYTARVEDNDPFGWNEGNARRAKNYRGDLEYAMNKRLQIYFSAVWARLFAQKAQQDETKTPFVAAMHPGWSSTPGAQQMYPSFYEKNKENFRTQEAGADTIIWLAAAKMNAIKGNANDSLKTSWPVKSVSGNFWLDRHIVPREMSWSYNAVIPSTEQKAWDQAEEWTGIGYEYIPRQRA